MNESKNNVFESIENDPNYDELMKNFKLTCPVKKINLVLEEPNCIAGMYCMASKDVDIKSKADLNNVNDNTLLFFTNQHIVELAKFMYGMMLLIAENNGVAKESIISIIAEYCNECRQIIPYYKYKKYCNDIINKYFNLTKSGLTAKVLSKFTDIMETMIFIPYNTLDELAQTGISEFKKNMEEKKGDE